MSSFSSKRGPLFKRRFIVYRLQLLLISFFIATTIFGAVALAFVLALIHDLDEPPSASLVSGVLVGCMLYFTLICVFVSVFTNRFFGPIYRIHANIQAQIKGETVGPLTVRTDDYFQEIVSDFNKMISMPDGAREPLVGPRDENGFTLIELVLVVAILGILVTSSIGSINSWIKRSHLSRDQAVIIDALTQARDLARSRHECVEVTIATPTVTTEPHLPNATSGRCIPPLGAKTISVPTVTIGTDLAVGQFSNGSNSILFSANGSVADGTVTTLKIENGSHTSTFTIYPAIGLIRSK